MRNWHLVDKYLKELEKSTSPFRQTVLDYTGRAFIKMAASIFLIATGVMLSFELGNRTMLPRAGYLIVVLGVVVVIGDLDQAIAGKSRRNSREEEASPDLD